MDQKEKHPEDLGLFPGVGLTSLATLMFQVALTRIFSVALWHHFAFMVVSIAFFGYGASGTFLMIIPKTRCTPPGLSRLAFILSVTILLSYWCSNRIPFDPARITWDRYQWIYLLACYAVLAIPFFFAGLILALVYTHNSDKIGHLYAWDLTGAGLGCTGIFLVYSRVGEAGSVLAVCLIASLASLVFSAGGWKLNLVRFFWMGILCVFLVTSPEFLNIKISPYKTLNVALRYPGSRLLETRWDAAGRIDVIESGAVRFAPGLSLQFHGSLPHQIGMCLDAGKLNAVTQFSGKREEIAFTEFLPASLPYYMLGTPNNVLIMEPMGGLDILIARYHGAKKIVTTHSNPLFVRLMMGPMKAFSGNLYGDNVDVVQEQGRSFLLRAPLASDVIQLPVTDSLGGLSSGLYGLAEDYTLTVEAFKTYIGALTPDGLLSVTQYLLPPPRHEIRLAAVASAALKAMGIKEPERHIAAIRTWGTFTLVIKRNPFTIPDVQRIKAFCGRLRFDLVYYPGMVRAEANVFNRFPGPIYHDMIEKVLNPNKREAFYEEYVFDVRPVTDDRPFFYHSFRMDKVVPLYRAVGNKWQLFIEGGYLVYLILLQALVIGLFLVALPLKKARLSSSWWLMVYFGLIGIAFMLTEVCLIQRFVLFLVRPAYAFSAVLFSVLVATALGSYHSPTLTQTLTVEARLRLQDASGQRKGLAPKLSAGRFRRRLTYLVAAPILILAYTLCLDNLLNLAMSWPLIVRHGVAFLVILPLGFVMGMFFPVGVRILGLHSESTIPWAWSLNGCASVVGSVLAVVIALSYGFKAVLCAAALAYALALFILFAGDFSYHWDKDYT